MVSSTDNIDVRLAIAEKDISNLGQILVKFDTAIEKISDLSASIKEILSEHNYKINSQEKVGSDLTEKIDALEKKFDDKLKDTNDRITKIDYIKYFVMGVAVLILAKLNIPLPAL